MIPVKTDYSNVTFTAEGCLDLPGTLAKNQDNIPEIETCWKLSPEELAQVNKTGCIFLYVMGHKMPPVALTTESMITLPGGAEDEI